MDLRCSERAFTSSAPAGTDAIALQSGVGQDAPLGPLLITPVMQLVLLRAVAAAVGVVLVAHLDDAHIKAKPASPPQQQPISPVYRAYVPWA